VRHAALLAALLLAVGCVSTSDVELLHREITDVGKRVDDLARQSSDKDDLKTMSAQLATQNSEVLKSNADIQAELRELRDQIEALQASLEVTSQRLEAVANELAASRERAALGAPPAAAPGAPGVTPAAAAAGGAAAGAAAAAAARPSEPAILYSSAYEDYLRGNFDLAIQGFRDYAQRYPGTDLTDNALYWIGECHYSKREFKPAIDAFTELLNGFRTSDKAAPALLKKGLAYLELGDKSQAVINLQYVLYEHPGTKEAELARTKLASLGVKVR
jgi:tol-pal system protein YbgF